MDVDEPDDQADADADDLPLRQRSPYSASENEYSEEEVEEEKAERPSSQAPPPQPASQDLMSDSLQAGDQLMEEMLQVHLDSMSRRDTPVRCEPASSSAELPPQLRPDHGPASIDLTGDDGEDNHTAAGDDEQSFVLNSSLDNKQEAEEAAVPVLSGQRDERQQQQSDATTCEDVPAAGDIVDESTPPLSQVYDYSDTACSQRQAPARSSPPTPPPPPPPSPPPSPPTGSVNHTGHSHSSAAAHHIGGGPVQLDPRYILPRGRMQVKAVPGDGSCLFHAFHYAIPMADPTTGLIPAVGNNDGADVQRAAAVQYWRRAKKRISSPDPPRTWGDYLKDMSHSRTWGSAIEVQALANIHQCDVIVFEAGQLSSFQFFPQSGHATARLFLLLSNNHYDPIHYTQPSGPGKPPQPPQRLFRRDDQLALQLVYDMVEALHDSLAEVEDVKAEARLKSARKVIEEEDKKAKRRRELREKWAGRRLSDHLPHGLYGTQPQPPPSGTNAALWRSPSPSAMLSTSSSSPSTTASSNSTPSSSRSSTATTVCGSPDSRTTTSSTPPSTPPPPRGNPTHTHPSAPFQQTSPAQHRLVRLLSDSALPPSATSAPPPYVDGEVHILDPCSALPYMVGRSAILPYIHVGPDTADGPQVTLHLLGGLTSQADRQYVWHLRDWSLAPCLTVNGVGVEAHGHDLQHGDVLCFGGGRSSSSISSSSTGSQEHAGASDQPVRFQYQIAQPRQLAPTSSSSSHGLAVASAHSISSSSAMSNLLASFNMAAPSSDSSSLGEPAKKQKRGRWTTLSRSAAVAAAAGRTPAMRTRAPRTTTRQSVAREERGSDKREERRAANARRRRRAVKQTNTRSGASGGRAGRVVVTTAPRAATTALEQAATIRAAAVMSVAV